MHSIYAKIASECQFITCTNCGYAFICIVLTWLKEVSFVWTGGGAKKCTAKRFIVVVMTIIMLTCHTTRIASCIKNAFEEIWSWGGSVFGLKGKSSFDGRKFYLHKISDVNNNNAFNPLTPLCSGFQWKSLSMMNFNLI